MSPVIDPPTRNKGMPFKLEIENTIQPTRGPRVTPISGMIEGRLRKRKKSARQLLGEVFVIV